MHDLVAEGVAALAIGPPHEEALLEEAPHRPVDVGLREPAAVGEDPHGEVDAHLPVALVGPEHAPEQLVEHSALGRGEAGPCRGAYHDPRDPGVVDALLPPGLVPRIGIRVGHGRPPKGQIPPPERSRVGCRGRAADTPDLRRSKPAAGHLPAQRGGSPRAADVPRTRENTRDHRQP
jgi:hypothetical protein